MGGPISKLDVKVSSWETPYMSSWVLRMPGIWVVREVYWELRIIASYRIPCWSVKPTVQARSLQHTVDDLTWTKPNFILLKLPQHGPRFKEFFFTLSPPSISFQNEFYMFQN